VAYPLPPGEIDGTPIDEVRHKNYAVTRKRGTPVRKIAKAMKRSEGSLRQKAMGSRYCARPSSFKRSIKLASKADISCNRCLKDFLLNLCYGQGANWLHILGVEFMKNVVEFRAQATLCRQLAMCEPKNSSLWLAEAERWSRLAQDEISSHYQECNVIAPIGAAEATVSRPNVSV
jgi:hypothetical protein